ncbi:MULTISPECIES: Uma2 family endonuclease [unclassified Streptomyces]|uniref:Uma2 family endonuclease n=1 Tax=unclassified Streptomyces TaxID=2593676 RepID=UPI001F3540AE|nr:MULTISPECIES: Uma2 family endonuclease [unclassified Streptomyces]
MAEPLLEDAFSRLSAAAPDGWRVELIEGEIHVTPPANGEHEEYVSEAADQITTRRQDQSLRNYTGIGLNVPGASQTGHVIPDLVVAPKGTFDNKEEWHDPAPVLMVPLPAPLGFDLDTAEF